jgi:DNA polymerase III delta subunit
MRFNVVIILLVLSLLPLYSCGGEPPAPSQAVTKVLQLKAKITEVVTDEERQIQVLKLADKMEKQVKKLEGLSGSTRNKLFKTYKKTESAPEDFEKVLNRYSEKRMKSVNKLVDLRVQMKQLVSEEEWTRLAEGLEFVR